MKKLKLYLMLLTLGSLSSCDYLDYEGENLATGKTEEEAYAYYDNLNSLTAYVYTFLPADFGSVNDAMLESASDNSVYTWENNAIYNMNNGVWSPLNTVDTQWTLWTGIRSANSFLEKFDPEVLNRFEYNDNFDEMISKSEKFPYEVRFLRAFYFFELAKRYGDIPLLTRTYAQEEINTVEKASFSDVIDFIVTECTEIAPELPVDQNDFWAETGRVTKGAALALKSRALLYAASPLHNPEVDAAKWEAAAKAAYEVIAMGEYSLPALANDPLYSDQGGNEVLQSLQLIFERRSSGVSSDFEARNEPMGYEGAEGGNTPSQNLVDAYELKDGTEFDWNNASHVANMYYDASGNQTRDPRLYLNVLINGSTWLGETVETFEGGKNKILENSTRTGYYLRKYMNPSVSLDPVTPNELHHHYILFRYAEILLNYAEAMFEWQGADATTTDCPLSARDALNQVRASAGMPNVTVTGDEFREKLRNERRVELAFEGHRFFDVRRWKIAGTDEVRNIYGVQITRNSSDSYSYQRVLLETRYWDDKMYLYPFPQNEVYLNENLTQNTGW